MNSFVALTALSVLLLVCVVSDAKPMFQSLSARDGYVPVYIRVGDTPLDEINPALANAFNEENILGRNIATDVEAEMQADQPAGSNSSDSSSEEDKKTTVAAAKQPKSSEEEKKTTGAAAKQPKSSEESAESNESKTTVAPVKEEAPAVAAPEASAPEVPVPAPAEPAPVAEEAKPEAVPEVMDIAATAETTPEKVAEEAKVEPTNY